jgi:uncharacterized repeat protein (TIGR04076 family)
MTERFGYRVVGTIKSIKGTCGAGHKVGDKLELSAHNAGGLCGFFYHNIFPHLVMLQFGGSFPADWGDPDVLVQDCPDRLNCVTMELRRIK